MSGLQKIGILIAGTGMITAAFLPGRTTTSGITALFNGLSGWTKTAQGR